jgi:ElaB/YqjD/DUF883 family membrane-anchored ribosome-binding protein
MLVEIGFMSVTQQDVKEGKINDQIENQLESISAQVEAGMEQGRARMAEWRAAAGEKTRRAKDSLNTMAREQPWQLVGGAVVLGFVFGLLFGRR